MASLWRRATERTMCIVSCRVASHRLQLFGMDGAVSGYLFPMDFVSLHIWCYRPPDTLQYNFEEHWRWSSSGRYICAVGSAALMRGTVHKSSEGKKSEHWQKCCRTLPAWQHSSSSSSSISSSSPGLYCRPGTVYRSSSSSSKSLGNNHSKLHMHIRSAPHRANQHRARAIPTVSRLMTMGRVRDARLKKKPQHLGNVSDQVQFFLNSRLQSSH